MQFCPACDNLLHMQIGVISDSSENKSGGGAISSTEQKFPLTMYCKHCPYNINIKGQDQSHVGGDAASTAYSPSNSSTFNPCLYRSNYSYNHPLYYSSIVNEYTFDDPTLPCVSVPCPIKTCPSATDSTLVPETMYVRFNDQDMRYLYLCKHCRHCWSINNQNENEVIFDFSSSGKSKTHA